MNSRNLHNPGMGISYSQIRFLILVGLALYFLFFAAFSVFHAYNNSEFEETTCVIGQCVQNGQVIVFGIVLLSVVLACLSYQPVTGGFFIRGPVSSSVTARAPPSSSCQ
jgi:hypothetical protein